MLFMCFMVQIKKHRVPTFCEFVKLYRTMTTGKRKTTGRLLLAVLPLILALYACGGGPDSHVRIRDGVAYGRTEGNFRHRWWNYYERGLSYADGQFYEEALADLEEALKHRDADQRSARTYGHHLIDYFPNRERGIIYYRTGQHAAAEDSLELSIRQYPSAKARFYLDRVRRALIEQSALPVAPPHVIVDGVQDEFWTRDDPVVVKGRAEDESFVSQVVINGRSVFLEGAAKQVRFSEKLSLTQGRHRIAILAANLVDVTREVELVVHVDREGPLIVFDDLPSAGSVSRGVVWDEGGVAELVVNGRHLPVDSGAGTVEVPFRFVLPIGSEKLEMRATDRLGNVSFSRFNLSEVMSKSRQVLTAAAEPLDRRLLASIFHGSDQVDTTPPVIAIEGLTDSQTVFLENIYLEGNIRDDGRIVRLHVNEIPLLKRTGKFVVFNHVVPLKEGANTITVAAEDEHGNRSVRVLSIERKIPEVLLPEERMRIAVLPFKRKGNVSDASLSFQDSLISALFEQNRFNLIERELLGTVLQEHKLSRSDLGDADASLEAGRIAAAQYLITGSIIETRTGIEIVSRVVDSETSEKITTQDVYGESRDLRGIRQLARGMAIKFHLDFPLVRGDVLTAMEKNVAIDIGKDRLKRNRHVIVFREMPMMHPETGKILGMRTAIVGHARITQSQEEVSLAEMKSEVVLKTATPYSVITE